MGVGSGLLITTPVTIRRALALKLTLKLAQIPKSEILPKVGVKDEASRKTSAGAMGAGLGMEGPQ